MRITVIERGGARSTVNLERDVITIGRTADNDLALPDLQVSRRHALLTEDNGQILIEDADSANGTFVNSRRVTTKTPVGVEGVIEIGSYQLLVSPTSTPPSASDAVLSPNETADTEARGAAIEVRAAAGAPTPYGAPQEQALQALKARIHDLLLEHLNLKKFDPNRVSDEEFRARTRKAVDDIVDALDRQVPKWVVREHLVKEVLDDALGLGPLEDFVADPEVTEIMVNRFDQVYVERRGKIEPSRKSFTSDRQVLAVIERIVAPLGRRIDESSPMVDARLKDGSRVHAIIPPLALKGPTLTIRKFPGDPLTAEDLVRLGSVSRGILQFLQACVSARRNILISGGTGSGKTTLLNVLSSFLPEHERILTIEDSAELRLRQVHVVSLEARPPNIEGKGQVTIRELVRNALRMRPDRIVVGECRGGEALDMLQAMNTGHDGSLTTIHANSPADAIARLETLVLMAGLDLPSRAIREQIASAIHIVVQTARLMDGSRKVVGVSAVTDLVDGQVRLQDVFRFTQTGLGERGAVIGRFNPTGWAPPFIAELPRQGIHLDPGVFEANRGGGIDPAGAAEPVAGNLFHTVRGGTP